MTLLSSLRKEWNRVWKDVREIIFLRSQLLKSEIIEWVCLFIAHIFFLLFFSVLLFILLLTAIASIGFYIMEWTQSAGLGFSFSTLMLLITLAVVWKLKTPLVITPVKRFFIRMFNNKTILINPKSHLTKNKNTNPNIEP
jgi:hypothetical protein